MPNLSDPGRKENAPGRALSVLDLRTPQRHMTQADGIIVAHAVSQPEGRDHAMKKRQRAYRAKLRRHEVPAQVVNLNDARAEYEADAPLNIRLVPQEPHPDDIVFPTWLIDVTRGHPNSMVVAVICCGYWYRSEQRPPIVRRADLAAIPSLAQLAPRKLDRAIRALLTLGLMTEIRLEGGARAYCPSPEYPDLVPTFEDVARVQRRETGD